ncbi:hypothetical protein OUZ56_027872 [Daphnia magna]|uniref:Transmembrane protein n=1 Tax=Daphnia magna TaxID=35525 RepID=A0ABR0B2E1_9CRUS|nr:hypothetical protein OUZ56_027872 [Daphnia magna]
MKKILPSKKDHQQCKINGLEYLISFYNLFPLIISFLASNVATSSLRPSSRFRFARRPVFVSPVAQSWLHPLPHLRFARRPVFVSPVAPSSFRSSPCLRFARHPVFTPPVTPSSLRPSPCFHFAPSSPRLCGIIVFFNV